MKRIQFRMVLLTLLLSSRLLGEGISDTLNLDPVVVVGKRMETHLGERADALTLLNESEIETLSPMSMPDLLSAEPGVFMQKTNHGGGSPFIRGLTGYHTLILVDGIRLNNAVFRSGPNQYLNTLDPLMLEQVEVMRGPGSLQYGSDAIGGTIYLRSRRPEFTREGRVAGGKVYTKWMSHNQEKTGRVQLHAASEGVAFTGGVSRKLFGNIHAGDTIGSMDYTSYDEWSGDASLRIRLAESNQVQVSVQHHRQNDIQLYHKLIGGDYSSYSFDPQIRNLCYVKHSYQNRNGGVLESVRSFASLNHSAETRRKQKSGSAYWDLENDRVHSFGLGVDAQLQLTSSWRSVNGIEAYYDQVNSSATRTWEENGRDSLMRGLYPECSDYRSLAIYSLHYLRFGPVELDGGLRYNYFSLRTSDEAFGEQALTPDALVGSLGISWEVVARTRIWFRMNNAFRAPNVNDVSSVGIADFRYEIPNFDLQPEKSFNKEVGLRTRQSAVSASLSLYHNRLNDLIANVRTTYEGQDSIDGVQVYHKENVGTGVIKGLEAEVEYRLNSLLNFRSFLVYTHGRNISKDEPIRRIPPLNGLLSLYILPFEGFTLGCEWQAAAMQDRLSSGDVDDSRIPEGGTPGWNTLNIRLSYSYRILEVNTGVINLFDALHKTHGSGVYQPGRSMYVSLAVKLGSLR